MTAVHLSLTTCSPTYRSCTIGLCPGHYGLQASPITRGMGKDIIGAKRPRQRVLSQVEIVAGRPISSGRTDRAREAEVAKLDLEIEEALRVASNIRDLIRKTDNELDEAKVKISRCAHEVIIPSFRAIFEQAVKLTESLAHHRLLLAGDHTPIDFRDAMSRLMQDPFSGEREPRLGLFPEWAAVQAALEKDPKAPLPADVEFSK